MRTDSRTKLIAAHVAQLSACRLCPRMQSHPVTSRPVASRVLLVGQAPGDREPKLGRPFAWTAGRTLFRWFEEHCGLDEETFRSTIYMAAVCRCFPGKKPTGGDRVPDAVEIEICRRWLRAELQILKPLLIVPVGKLAIASFVPCDRLDVVIGRKFRIDLQAVGLLPEAKRSRGHQVDVIPLPHPSGASPWPRIEPGKSLVRKAMRLIAVHPALATLDNE